MIFLLLIAGAAYVAVRTRPAAESAPTERRGLLKRLFGGGTRRPRTVHDVFLLAWLVVDSDGTVMLGLYGAWLDVTWLSSALASVYSGAPNDAGRERPGGSGADEGALHRAHELRARGEHARAAAAYKEYARSCDEVDALYANEDAARCLLASSDPSAATFAVYVARSLCAAGHTSRAAALYERVGERPLTDDATAQCALDAARRLRASDDGAHAVTVALLDYARAGRLVSLGRYAEASDALLCAASCANGVEGRVRLYAFLSTVCTFAECVLSSNDRVAAVRVLDAATRDRTTDAYLDCLRMLLDDSDGCTPDDAQRSARSVSGAPAWLCTLTDRVCRALAAPTTLL